MNCSPLNFARLIPINCSPCSPTSAVSVGTGQINIWQSGATELCHRRDKYIVFGEKGCSIVCMHSLIGEFTNKLNICLPYKPNSFCESGTTELCHCVHKRINIWESSTSQPCQTLEKVLLGRCMPLIVAPTFQEMPEITEDRT